jgi:membrane-bound inhibitor of C-type lysozyme
VQNLPSRECKHTNAKRSATSTGDRPDGGTKAQNGGRPVRFIQQGNAMPLRYHARSVHAVDAAVPVRRKIALGAVAAVVLLSGCVASGLPTTVLPSEVRYDCQQGGALTVLRAPDGRQAEASFQNRRMVLPRVDSAAQEKYGNGRVTLYLDGEKALLTEDSMVLTGRCESVVALPVAPQTRY